MAERGRILQPGRIYGEGCASQARCNCLAAWWGAEVDASKAHQAGNRAERDEAMGYVRLAAAVLLEERQN